MQLIIKNSLIHFSSFLYFLLHQYLNSLKSKNKIFLWLGGNFCRRFHEMFHVCFQFRKPESEGKFCRKAMRFLFVVLRTLFSFFQCWEKRIITLRIRKLCLLERKKVIQTNTIVSLSGRWVVLLSCLFVYILFFFFKAWVLEFERVFWVCLF